MIVAAALMSGGLVIASSGAATAATHVHAKYKVTGSTFLKAPNFTLTRSSDEARCRTGQAGRRP